MAFGTQAGDRLVQQLPEREALDRFNSSKNNESPKRIHTLFSASDKPVVELEEGIDPPANTAFPRCHAAVRNRDGNEWELADAILAECSEPGKNGVRNASHAKIEAMLEEIAKNYGVDLSFERARKLRSVAANFPPGRRRPGVSLEGHLEAKTPKALDELITAAPTGTVLTRNYIREAVHPAESPARTPKQDTAKAERDRQAEDHRKGFQNICAQQERRITQLEERYMEVCRSAGKDPEPLPALPSPEEEPSRTTSEKLEQSVRVLLTLHGLDPAADGMKQAIAAFVQAVVAQ